MQRCQSSAWRRLHKTHRRMPTVLLALPLGLYCPPAALLQLLSHQRRRSLHHCSSVVQTMGNGHRLLDYRWANYRRSRVLPLQGCRSLCCAARMSSVVTVHDALQPPRSHLLCKEIDRAAPLQALAWHCRPGHIQLAAVALGHRGGTVTTILYRGNPLLVAVHNLHQDVDHRSKIHRPSATAQQEVRCMARLGQAQHLHEGALRRPIVAAHRASDLRH